MEFNGRILRHRFAASALRARALLPDLAPSDDARAHSARLSSHIREAIARAGGWIPFDRYMDLALYAPGLGYYAAGSHKFGGAGDFVTAPELSPLFGQCVARPVAQVVRDTGGDVLELGPGTGRLAATLLTSLAEDGALPHRYLLLEPSADLRERQAAYLRATVPALADRTVWLDALPDTLDGIVIANEVLDALPVRVVEWHEDGLYEAGVTTTDGGFTWALRPLEDPGLRAEASALSVPRPYRSEFNLRAGALVATLAERLRRGALLFVDYGFGQSEYYHPQRNAGTLLCHSRHHALDDPFRLPGLQDVTAHVDFTRVARAGIQAGLTLAGYTTQAHFLVDCGITDQLSRASPHDAKTYLPLVAGAQKLLAPQEMGELFKAIAFTRGVAAPLPGFRAGDLSRLL